MHEAFHQGEQKVQQLTGEQAVAKQNARIIGNTIIQGAINFIEKQPMMIVSSIDDEKNIWTSLLIGDFGFLKVIDQQHLSLESSKIHSNQSDIFFSNIERHPKIGTLFIELATRRRFRINGRTEWQGDHLQITVEEAYPNCPKYIQRRVIEQPEHFQSREALVQEGNSFNASIKEWISQADTFFVGSQSQAGYLDVSHRGGNQGFIEILADNTLKIPDYPGNSMFNTLGNFVQNPKAGLLFIDFQKGRTLQLRGEVELLFNQNNPQDLEKSAETGRFWLFKTQAWIQTNQHHQVNWQFLDYSPFNP